jgi:YD repeat-containing protein
MLGNGQNINYMYNDSGYRTVKTVTSITSKYYHYINKVLLENNVIDSIYYSYNADDKLVSMTLNGIEYLYI